MAEEFSAEELAAQQAAIEERKAEEAARIAREEKTETRRIRLEVVRLAKEALIENSRYKAVDERDVSAEDISNFANVLYTYTNT